jgi:hypothetical protein
MPETTTIPSARTTRGSVGRNPRRAPVNLMEGERLERPLHTVPYPVEPCHGVCLDTRDVQTEDDVVRYRSARW